MLHRFEGNASSIRILSRILPMILADEIARSSVGEAILRLEELCQLITAPKMTLHEIQNILHYSIIEYLELRVQLIEAIDAPPVRPKHHFVSHYAQIYIDNGPLIHLWAMRMESKHCFFKCLIRQDILYVYTCQLKRRRKKTYSFLTWY